jgi:hypothetical protein
LFKLKPPSADLTCPAPAPAGSNPYGPPAGSPGDPTTAGARWLKDNLSTTRQFYLQDASGGEEQFLGVGPTSSCGGTGDEGYKDVKWLKKDEAGSTWWVEHAGGNYFRFKNAKKIRQLSDKPGKSSLEATATYCVRGDPKTRYLNAHNCTSPNLIDKTFAETHTVWELVPGTAEGAHILRSQACASNASKSFFRITNENRAELAGQDSAAQFFIKIKN